MVPVPPFAQKKSGETITRQPAENLVLTHPSFCLSNSALTPQTGQTASTKYSLKKQLDSLGADSYQKRLNDDPAFNTAVDRLQNGNDPLRFKLGGSKW